MRTEYSLRRRFFSRNTIVAALALCWMGVTTASLEANPQADAHFKNGLRLSQQKKWAAAEAQYRKAIALDPKNASYQSYLADSLAAQGKFGAAQQTYQQSEKTKQADPQPTYKRPSNNKVKSGTGAKPKTPNTKQSTSTKTPTTSRTGNSAKAGRGGGVGNMPNFPLPPSEDDTQKTSDDQETMTLVTPDGRTITVTTRPGETVTIPIEDK